ncbi:MAG: VOC family protein [Ignavibacteria bacterium]
MENKSNFRKLTPNLMVSDVNKTVEFYKKAFNFDIVATVPDTGVYNFAIVVSGKTELMFQKKESFEEDFGIRDNSQAGGTFSLYIEVTNILMVYDKAVLSANVIKELHQTFYGTKEFSVRDDNGYILTFAETLKK